MPKSPKSFFNPPKKAKYRHVGFTGTRRGMTTYQRRRVHDALVGLLAKRTVTEFHHGWCVGADAQAHKIAADLGFKIVGHPPKEKKHRARIKPGDVPIDVRMKRPLPYLERNRKIVEACDVLVATPKERKEVLRSGTWATIREARRRGKTVIIVPPMPVIERKPSRAALAKPSADPRDKMETYNKHLPLVAATHPTWTAPALEAVAKLAAHNRETRQRLLRKEANG